MSVTTFVLSDEVKAAIAASTNPIVLSSRDILLGKYESGAKAEAALSQVAEAREASAKAIDESDNAEAVAYRKLVARKAAMQEKIDAEVAAAKAEIEAKYADNVAKAKAAISEQRSKALAALADGVNAEVDTTDAAAEFTATVAIVAGLAPLYKSAGIDLEFRKRSADSAQKGKVSKAGATGTRRVRWETLTVDGQEVGTLSGAAKAIGLSAAEASGNYLLNLLERDNGNVVGGKPVSVTVTYNGKDFVLAGTPKVAGSSDDE